MVQHNLKVSLNNIFSSLKIRLTVSVFLFLAETEPAPLRTRTPSDEENKENKLITIPEQPASSSSCTSAAKPQPSVELRNKNPFLANDRKISEPETKAPVPKRPASKMFGRVSKFKHLKGDVILKGRFENLKNLSKTCPAECDYVKGEICVPCFLKFEQAFKYYSSVLANADRIALPLTGPGGKIAVFETRKPGRIPDGVQPVLINGTSVMDFAFDPFDNSRLAVACDDGYVRIWKIPDGGLVQQVNEPDMMFAAHADKITIVKFHPLAKDVILTSAFDRTVKIWDLNRTEEPQIELEVYSTEIAIISFDRNVDKNLSFFHN